MKPVSSFYWDQKQQQSHYCFTLVLDFDWPSCRQAPAIQRLAHIYPAQPTAFVATCPFLTALEYRAIPNRYTPQGNLPSTFVFIYGTDDNEHAMLVSGHSSAAAVSGIDDGERCYHHHRARRWNYPGKTIHTIIVFSSMRETHAFRNRVRIVFFSFFCAAKHWLLGWMIVGMDACWGFVVMSYQ